MASPSSSDIRQTETSEPTPINVFLILDEDALVKCTICGIYWSSVDGYIKPPCFVDFAFDSLRRITAADGMLPLTDEAYQGLLRVNIGKGQGGD